MKHISKYIFIIALLSVFAGCSDEKDVIIVEPVEKIGNVYGLGTIFGWDSNAGTPLTQDADNQDLFVIEKVIKHTEENKQFKFTIDKGDWDQVRYLVPTSVDYGESVKLATDGEYDMFLCSEMNGDLRDHFWGIPEGTDGTYKLTVNAKALKLKVERISDNTDEPEGPEEPDNCIYGLGMAFGWDSNSPTLILEDPDNPEQYIAEVDLDYSAENKQFKFTIDKGNWDKVHYLVPTTVDFGVSVKLITTGEYDMFLCSELDGNLRDHFWGIEETASGKYKLTINPTTLKLKVEKL